MEQTKQSLEVFGLFLKSLTFVPQISLSSNSVLNRPLASQELTTQISVLSSEYYGIRIYFPQKNIPTVLTKLVIEFQGQLLAENIFQLWVVSHGTIVYQNEIEMKPQNQIQIDLQSFFVIPVSEFRGEFYIHLRVPSVYITDVHKFFIYPTVGIVSPKTIAELPKLFSISPHVNAIFDRRFENLLSQSVLRKFCYGSSSPESIY